MYQNTVDSAPTAKLFATPTVTVIIDISLLFPPHTRPHNFGIEGVRIPTISLPTIPQTPPSFFGRVASSCIDRHDHATWTTRCTTVMGSKTSASSRERALVEHANAMWRFRVLSKRCSEVRWWGGIPYDSSGVRSTCCRCERRCCLIMVVVGGAQTGSFFFTGTAPYSIVACDPFNNGSKVTDYSQACFRPRVDGCEPTIHQIRLHHNGKR